jgi:6-phosphogluconolactonase/glucosamine-6-phosphate isomerase/deaminase
MECKRINDFIRQNGPLDLMMVGLGMNGHVGLNEPGVDFSLHAHISELQDNTKTVAKKYFQKEVFLSEGITHGPKDLLDSKIAILIASGSKKAGIVARALEGEINENIPASIFQQHPNAYVFLDSEAAGLLSK